MKIELLHHTPLWVAVKAIRKCWASEGKSDTCMHHEILLYGSDTVGEKDKALIYRVGNKNKHSSTLEHLVYTFDIDGISRALLQEFARHRMASLSVKSTRYTLKELKDEEPFITEEDENRASKYCVMPDNMVIREGIVHSLETLRTALELGISNDTSKYILPEAYKTSLVWTINARSLQNFLKLRSSRAALPEIQKLANAVFEALPEEHKYLFEEFVTETD